ncbi:hypothetical protein PTSG_06693 [Salpingoeca rosetta]|uniref:Major facilitator superfamily (MFS) profile domain-containing protein n=1 Tax=Salpingoeca rosetta (strain ATCC 50818 / BSB-021) TaxID=946362 RepID=F2UFR1_SALR5|nr:uncharacterized protein PTSG_06693 [Salpingoeca rosetta]EGD75629.1 hypothetical protein PTSG_06693 [Salpingoeca rosetta]|eukprot:XP_004992086.1 hypothetical protein PTSG_06693 [Salpingoeca rosetta]
MTLSAQDRRRSLIVLGVFWFFTGVEYAVILPSAWQYLQNLGAEHKIWLSISISSFSFANFLFSPLYGRFADRYSTKTILIVSNFFELVGNLLYLIANDVYTNVESRFIAGMGAAAGSAIFAYVGRVSETPADLNRNMGAIMTARAIGLILGPAFNFLLVKIDWRVGQYKIDPYNSPGLLMTIIWLICQVIVVKYFKDIPKADVQELRVGSSSGDKAEADVEASATTDQQPQRVAGAHGGESSTDPAHSDNDEDPLIPTGEDDTPKCSEFLGLGVIALLLVQFLNMFNQTAYETFITPFTQNVFHWNQVANSIVYMITAFVAIAVYIIISKLQPKYGILDRTEILVGVVLQLFGFIIFWLLPAHNAGQLWKFALGSVVFVGGLPFVYIAPALQAKLTTMRTQGLGQGIRRSVMSAAQIIGPLWATLSGDDNGAYFWGGMVGLTALCVVIMVLAWKALYFPMMAKPKAPPSPPKGSGVLTEATHDREDREDRPLLASSRTSSVRSEDDAMLRPGSFREDPKGGIVRHHGSIN